MATEDVQSAVQATVPADSMPSAAAEATQQLLVKTEESKETKPRPPRQQRPNYAQIHSKPLPYEVFPLPAFIPHNPLSLVRIAFAMLSRSLWAPAPHVVIHVAYFSPETQSVHVTDPKAIRALWEQGFWGSGSLSRSEPRWLDLEKRKRGIKAMQTSEEVTQQRRRERRQFKLERARLEREAIEEQRRAEAKLIEEQRKAEEKLVEAEKMAHVPAYVWNAARLPLMGPEPVEAGDAPADIADVVDDTPDVEDLEPLDTAALLDDATLDSKEAEEEDMVPDLPVAEEEPAEISDQEHLQLTLEEAFFLSYVLGVLNVCDQDGTKLSNPILFRLYCANAVFPPPAPTTITQSLTTTHLSLPISPDNAFLLKYVTFHHFRSLGWVVRSGIKFAVDFLLYNRGPAFSHAEFAVMVLPEYAHPYWKETEERRVECQKKAGRDWWWLHRVNRVQGLAHKTLMLVYVEVPPPWDEGEGGNVDIGKTLGRYKVREFVIGRWTPNRHR